MKHTITCVITTLNDNDECTKTIASIRATAPKDFPIVVVDDASDAAFECSVPHVHVIRNKQRCGVGPSRHIGVLASTTDTVFLLDSHMRMDGGWWEIASKITKDEPNTAFCARCVALFPDQMDLQHAINSKNWYQGASFNFLGQDPNKQGETQIMESVWMPDFPGDLYPCPSLMGASYLIPDDAFLHVNGLRLLRLYGSDEPYLSLKLWLAGYTLRICKSLRVGHQFRKDAGYQTEVWNMIYNKILMAETVLPEPYRSKILNSFGDSPSIRHAFNQIKNDAHLIAVERAYLSSIFVRDFPWLLNHFKIPFPL